MFSWLASMYAATPRFRGKNKGYRFLLCLFPFQYSRSRHGVIMKRNMRDSTYRRGVLGLYGSFIESHIINIDRPFAFIDFGANQGLYSLIAARNVHCKQIFAFEPNPYTFRYLVENIDLNKAAVVPICAALVSGNEKFLDLRWNRRHSGGGTLLAENSNSETITVLGVNRGYIDGLPLSDLPIVLKIDVEGYEPALLSEVMSSAISDRIIKVIVEISENTGGKGQFDRISAVLDQYGLMYKSRAGKANHFDAVFERELIDVDDPQNPTSDYSEAVRTPSIS